MKWLNVLAGLALVTLLVPGHAQTSPAQPQDPTQSAPASTAPSPQAAPPSARHSDEQTPPETAGSRVSASTGRRTKSRPFMGKIVLENSGYMLKAGDLEYKLDDQDKVRDFNGKNVKVLGSLDRQSNTIHIEKIEPSL